MATVTEEGESFTWGVRKAPLKEWHLKETRRPPEQGQGRAFQARENRRAANCPEEGQGAAQSQGEGREGGEKRASRTSVESWILC